MPFQKLTYGDSRCMNYVYFSFSADSFDTSIITNELKLEPTSVMIKKVPVPRSTSWDLRIDAGTDNDLSSHISQLVEILESRVDPINHLKRSLHLRTRLQLVLYIDIDPEASTPSFGLSQRTIDFLGKTKTEVGFDLYKADTIGLLDSLGKRS